MELQIERLGKVGITVEQEYWSNLRTYDKLTIVQVEGSASTYISRIPVPPHTYLNNRKYWIPLTKNNDAIFNEIIRYVDEHYISIVQFNQFCIDNGFQPIGSFSVTLPTQTNFTLSNTNTAITRGSSYQNTVTANAHYAISSVTVQMAGTDVTSEVYDSSTGVISIANVTGNIVISVTVVKTEFIINTSNVSGFAISGYSPNTYLSSGTPVTLTLTKSNSSYNVDTTPYAMMNNERINTQSSESPYTLSFIITGDVILYGTASLESGIYWGEFNQTNKVDEDIKAALRNISIGSAQRVTNNYTTPNQVLTNSFFVAYPQVQGYESGQGFPTVKETTFNSQYDFDSGKYVQVTYNSQPYIIWEFYNRNISSQIGSNLKFTF